MHVLVADDDERALAVLVSGLSQLGYAVIAVRSGTAALKAVQRNPSIRLAILNWMLPELDGLALAAELKPGRANLYTVVVVGSRFCDEVRDAFASWADRFVAKPLSPGTLLGLLGPGRTGAAVRQVPVPAAPAAGQAGCCGWGRRGDCDTDLPPQQRATARWN